MLTFDVYFTDGNNKMCSFVSAENIQEACSKFSKYTIDKVTLHNRKKDLLNPSVSSSERKSSSGIPRTQNSARVNWRKDPRNSVCKFEGRWLDISCKYKPAKVAKGFKNIYGNSISKSRWNRDNDRIRELLGR